MGRDSLPSMLEAGARAGPVIIRVRELFLNPTSCNTRRAGPALHQGSTIEPALLMKMWMVQSQSSEQGRAVPIPICPVVAWPGKVALLWSAGVREGPDPHPKLQDLHNRTSKRSPSESSASRV